MSNKSIMAKVIEISEKREKQVELSKMEVELTIASDLKSNGNKVSKIADKIVKESAKMEKLLQQYDKQRTSLLTVKKESESLEKALNSTLDRAESAAKELGVSPAKLDGYGMAKDSISKLNNFQSYTYPAVK